MLQFGARDDYYYGNRINRIAQREATTMSGNTYKQIMITGTSSESMEDAVNGAVNTAAKTIRHMRWFEVVETRGAIKENAIAEWQVTVRIGFLLED